LEVNSQTDFLALQDDFKNFVNDSIELAMAEKLTDAAPLIAARETARVELVGKVGENVNIRRLVRVEGDVLGAYVHGNKIGVIVALKGGDSELARDIAMHVAASNPEFLHTSEVSEEAVAREKAVFISLNEEKMKGKPAEIVEKMVSGRIQKFLAEASLVEQPFVKNPELTIGALAKKAGAEIVSFVRYGVGEGIDKGEVDFAAEVAAQLAASKQ
jgi:elongation factor Ts